MTLIPSSRFAVSSALPLLCALLLGAAPAVAAKVKSDPEPETLKTAAGMTEVGTLDAVPYRVDIPANWNHALVVFFHGYSEGPYTYRLGGPLTDQTQPLFDRGFAVIQSGYSTPGWALAEAYPETEQLRQYFLKKFVQPALGKNAKKDGNIETYVAGGSMGGALVVAALELNPKSYAGGLNLCGSVGPTDLAFQRRFAWRAAFDFYFPGLLPPIDPVPPDFQETRALRKKAEDALHANPTAAAAMRNITWLHTDHEVAENMVYFTYVIGDIQRRAHGNPFDNRNFLYSGSDPSSSATDNALNDGVRRYTGDPRAREYMLRHYTPTGRLYKPMVALQTTYDPRIPTRTLEVYKEQVMMAGFEQNLVQQYVHRDGHCTFTADEVGRTFDELVHWTRTGKRPTPGALPPARPAPSATASR